LELNEYGVKHEVESHVSKVHPLSVINNIEGFKGLTLVVMKNSYLLGYNSLFNAFWYCVWLMQANYGQAVSQDNGRSVLLIVIKWCILHRFEL
jgi:hypothetical protein